MSTRRLYFDDPALLAFDATVVAHGSYEGKPSIVLDASAFYPEAGGQLGDRGRLGDVRLVDVQVDDGGVVHHLVEANGATPTLMPAIGARVHGAIDKARRTTHRALHTAQHMLSRALVDVARAETVSSRLGETTCTIDVDLDLGPRGIDEAKIAEAERLVSSIVDDDVSVRAYFPDDFELASLPLRRAPKVTENVRVVSIGGAGALFDVSPCGGTHCTSTSQVGLLRVTGVERYKGKARIFFSAGRRARDELVDEASILAGLARDFTCGNRDVGAAAEKLRRALEASQQSHGRTRARLAEAIATSLWQTREVRGDEQWVVAQIADCDVDLLRVVAAKLVENARAVVVLAGDQPEGRPFIVERATGTTTDCGSLLKRLTSSCGGRGGGRADRAEGRLPIDADWRAQLTQPATS